MTMLCILRVLKNWPYWVGPDCSTLEQSGKVLCAPVLLGCISPETKEVRSYVFINLIRRPCSCSQLWRWIGCVHLYILSKFHILSRLYDSILSRLYDNSGGGSTLEVDRVCTPPYIRQAVKRGSLV